MKKDFIGEKSFAASQYKKEREYWLRKLSGELQRTGFPADFNKDGETGKRTGITHFKFSQPLFVKLMKIINDSDFRLHISLVMGLVLLLYKYTGNKDIIIGTPIDIQEIAGNFINTVLPLRNKIDEQITVREFLMQVKQTVIEASDHQNFPIETIPYHLNMSRVEEDFCLFDTAILLRNIHDKSYIMHMNLNLIFSFLRTETHIECVVEYNAAVFKKGTIERIINHYTHLLHEAFNRVDLKLVDIPVLTEKDRNEMLFVFNNTAAEYPRQKMIHELFEEQVTKTPGNIAVESKDEKITYKKLNEKANQLARLLRQKGIKTEIAVGIMLESSCEVLIAIMAVLKDGGAYLPMGFEYPEERIKYILMDSHSKILLTKRFLLAKMKIESPVIFVEDNELYTGRCENLNAVNNVNSLAYIIYTSGTTGAPKGVMVEHRGLVNYIWWAAQAYVKNERLDFPLYTSISFDLTVTSIFTPLITGNCIIVYGGVDKEFYIEKVIEENRVGVVKLTPSHLKLIRKKILKDSSIKRLIVGGEELETRLAKEIYMNFGGNIEIFNEYGPTESIVGCMIYKFAPGAGDTYSVPIGVPIANTRIYLLNEHFQPLPVGVEGEIYISGDGLARGYLFNPKLTREKFLPNPFETGQKMYRTGDLGIRLPDGNIEFKGRIDQQIKIRGYRVEVGEIEEKLINFQKISSSRREQKEDIVKKIDLKSVIRCAACLLPMNYPGIYFNEEGICNICREYETYREQALKYFKTVGEFYQVVERAQRTKRGDYDCLMLYSGGKDSSYVLHRLVEMGLKVLAFTFDNGYISDMAFENIKRTTSLLNVESIIMDSSAMKEIFVESLWSDYNVCNGCFKAVNTLGTKIAHDRNINLVVSGLTRGQIFDIKLHGLFKLGIFDEKSINERLKLFRKNYHSMTHRTSRLINVDITEEMLNNIYFADFFRYDDISVSEIFEYLKERDKGWIRPGDTGASSSNCIINDVGIYVHLKDKGFHFYSAQLSWDCRLGTITREEGIDEITGFKVDYSMTQKVLNEIGYYDAYTGAVVVAVEDGKGEKSLCAYIVADKEFDISELKGYLSKELPDYMIPTYFVNIDKIPLTANGKIDRKALPEPQLRLDGEYLAPRNDIERKLVGIWSEILGIKPGNIGIDVNFFELGGHSLRATTLVSEIHRAFNVRIPLTKVFALPRICELSTCLKEAIEDKFISLKTTEKKEFYPISAAQRRFYIVQQMDVNNTNYNIPRFVMLEGKIDPGMLAGIFKKIINRHESLRTSFEMIRGNVIQRVQLDFDFEIGYYDLVNGKNVEEITGDFVRAFNLSQAPLVRVGLMRIAAEQHMLMVDMHHIISDGVSYGIIIREFMALYKGEMTTPLKFQYKDYSEMQNRYRESISLKLQEEYWLKELEGELQELCLPTDYPRADEQDFQGERISFELNAEETRVLNEDALNEGATLFMVLLAIYNVFLFKISGQEDILVGTATAGRSHVESQQIIGLFLNMLVQRNFPKEEKRFIDFLGEVREKSLKAFENQDYPFDELVEKVLTKSNKKRNSLIDVGFAFNNLEFTEIEIPGLKLVPYGGRNEGAKSDLILIATEIGDSVLFTFEYSTKLFRRETIEDFIIYFKEIVSTVVDNNEIKLGEIKIASNVKSIGSNIYKDVQSDFDFK